MKDFELSNLEAEVIVLGILLAENQKIYKVGELAAADFYEPVHQRIFSAIERLVQAGKPATPVTMKAEFDADISLKELGGGKYLASLMGHGTAIVNIRDYAASVVDFSRRRQALNVLEVFQQRITELQSGESALDTLTGLSAECLKLMSSGKQNPIRTFAEVSMREAELLTERLPCFPTDIPVLDDAMGGGVYSKKSYCFAARPKNGKTMMLSTLAQNMAAKGVKVLYIAAEMGAGEIQQRNLARAIGRNSLAFVANRDDGNFIQKVINAARAQPKTAYYVDAPAITFDELRHYVSLAKANYGIDGFILDYLQLVQGKDRNQSEADFQAQVAQWVANTCRKENLFGVYAAQINREGSIRGSDGIVMAADQVYHLEMNETKDMAWAKQLVSRYTMQRDIGDKDNPMLVLDKHGPHFRQYGIEPEVSIPSSAIAYGAH